MVKAAEFRDFNDRAMLHQTRRRLVKKSRSKAVQCRSRPFAFQHSDLLLQSPDFQKRLHATSEQYAHGRQKCESQVEHE
jgi:hypothetical protein